MSTAESGLFAPARITNPERPFGFTELMQLLHRRGRTVLQVAAGVVLLTVLMTLIWPSRYSTTAVVMLDQRRNNITDRSQVLTELPTDPASVQNQIQILTSRDLAAAVIDHLGLAHDKEFNAALSPFPLNLFARARDASAQRSAVVDSFLKHLSVQAEGLSTALSVTFSADDGKKVARIDDALVDSYINSQVVQKSEAAQRTTRWLGTRIAQLARQVQDSDVAVQSYKAQNGLNDSGQGTQSLVDQQLSAINSQLVQARADLAQKQAANSHIQELMQSGRVADVSQVVASPLIVQLRQQQAEAIRNEAAVVTRYGPKHPKRVAAELALRDLDGKIEQEAERIAGSLANDVAVVRVQVQSLENNLAAMRSQSNTQNLAKVKLRALEASAASTRSMYESFVTRLREAQDQDGVTTPDARIISHASVPASPSFPPRLLLLCASIPAGLLFGLLCALVIDRSEVAVPVRDAMAFSRPITAPIVAFIPDARDPLAADQIVDAPASAFSRPLLSLAERLTTFPADARPRTILVSGFDPREAVASVALGLARALALFDHNVVLLDADLSRSAAARMAGFRPTATGLGDVLAGTMPLSRAVMRDTNSPVLVLASATAPAARAEWASGETRELLRHLRSVSDFLIIHAPAGLDMVPLVSLSESVLFVGSAGHERSLEQTAAAFAPASPHLGLVLVG